MNEENVCHIYKTAEARRKGYIVLKVQCVEFSDNKLKALVLPSPLKNGKGSSLEPKVGLSLLGNCRNMVLRHGGPVLGIECCVPNFSVSKNFNMKPIVRELHTIYVEVLQNRTTTRQIAPVFLLLLIWFAQS